MPHPSLARFAALLFGSAAIAALILVVGTPAAQSHPSPAKPTGVIIAVVTNDAITIAAQTSTDVKTPRIRRTSPASEAIVLPGDPTEAPIIDRPGEGDYTYELIDQKSHSYGRAEVAITSRTLSIRATQPLTFLGGTSRRGVFALTLRDGSERHFAVPVGERIAATFLADPKDADGTSSVIEVSTDFVLEEVTLEAAQGERRFEALRNPDGSPVLGIDGEPLTISIAGLSHGPPTSTARLRATGAAKAVGDRRLSSGQSVSIPALR